MGSYSLIKIGNDYVVRANDQYVLKLASRRRAAQLIRDAIVLLETQAPPVLASAPSDASQPCESTEVP